MNPLRIYVAGPYSGRDREEIERNVSRAIDAGIEIFLKGHFPYIPHLTDLVDQRAKKIDKPMIWDDFMRWDMPWLEVCDALLYLGRSNGADREVAEAERLGKRIFYSLEEVSSLDQQVNRLG